MWVHFVFENIQFSLSLFAAFVMFSIFWLYIDAWNLNKDKLIGLRALGFLFISFSFIFNAVLVDDLYRDPTRLLGNLQFLLEVLFRFIGYCLIIYSRAIETYLARPGDKYKSQSSSLISFALPIGVISGAELIYYATHTITIFPIFASLIALLYLRRATLGLEHHLRLVALGFYLLSISELLQLPLVLFQDVSNVRLYELLSPFGWLWIIKHVIFAISLVLLGRWVFWYLLGRLQTQLFIIFISTVLGIFLIVTNSFTFLLLKNINNNVLDHLETDAKVLTVALDSKKGSLSSDAQVIAQQPQITHAVLLADTQELARVSEQFLLTKQQSTVIITDKSGKVLARGEDNSRIGNSLSDHGLIKQALIGNTVSSVIIEDGVLAPIVSIAAAAPIKDYDSVIGAVLIGQIIDNAFVDGIKQTTGLEATIYGSNQISASTILGTNGNRSIGFRENNEDIQKEMLKDGTYTGSVTLLDTPYIGTFTALKDTDNSQIGMVFIGEPQSKIFESADNAIETTFISAALLLVLSIFPAYVLSRYITYAVK